MLPVRMRGARSTQGLTQRGQLQELCIRAVLILTWCKWRNQQLQDGTSQCSKVSIEGTVVTAHFGCYYSTCIRQDRQHPHRTAPPGCHIITTTCGASACHLGDPEWHSKTEDLALPPRLQAARRGPLGKMAPGDAASSSKAWLLVIAPESQEAGVFAWRGVSPVVPC